MLKQTPDLVFSSLQSSAYPSGEELPGSSGGADENCYAFGCLSPAASLDDVFEHPKKVSSVRLLQS